MPECVVCWLQTADFGPRTALKIVDSIRDKVKAGKIERGDQIRTALKASITELLHRRGGNPDLRLGQASPAVVLVVGVNGGGKTTSIGKLAHKFTSEGASVRMDGAGCESSCVCPHQLHLGTVLGRQLPAVASASRPTAPCWLPTAVRCCGHSSSLQLEGALVAWSWVQRHSVRLSACD